ncbi:uncharacterized protein EV422DRAFT_612189 [Fimicolochytrium jonesii]|uniref:uncharacterized protein n=1 Tax=Fimicolochytrium jonesii TaxID=1396493 RepID=UPI0022FDF446|nr:uncharacterized protein EV422DRAFT_612189 [Fimicolochytrium jonesii]KAI8823694.1 hypothetical protein EV422DRAFT_612189 [Fimicolochytrium jonesii]
MAHDYSWGRNVIRTFFEEHLPLMLDAPVIITSLNYNHFEEFVVCSLPFFIQMGKKNYVTIILCILGRLGFYRAHGLLPCAQHPALRMDPKQLPQNQAEQRVMFKAALQEADAQEAAVLNLRRGKLRGANAGTSLFQFRKDQKCNLQAAADKLLSILDHIIVYNRDHGGPAYERESRTAGKNSVTTRLYHFTAEPDGLLLGEAVIPLTQRRPNAQGHTVVKVGKHVDITRYAFPFDNAGHNTPCQPLSCGCCRHCSSVRAMFKQSKCPNCFAITKEIMQAVVADRNSKVQEWSQAGVAGEESDEEPSVFDVDEAS